MNHTDCESPTSAHESIHSGLSGRSPSQSRPLAGLVWLASRIFLRKLLPSRHLSLNLPRLKPTASSNAMDHPSLFLYSTVKDASSSEPLSWIQTSKGLNSTQSFNLPSTRSRASLADCSLPLRIPTSASGRSGLLRYRDLLRKSRRSQHFKSGGPRWIRTTDLTLIRRAL